MRGRTVPPMLSPSAPVIVALPRADDPSQAIDAAFFTRNPQRRDYTRRYIAGETVEAMHPDTRVYVLMIAGDRVRGFAPPAKGGQA